MRICLLGDTGDGKTITGVDFLKEYFDLGYISYCNLKDIRFESNYIDSINFNDIVNNEKPNVILIDEIGELGKSTDSTMFSFTQMITQSRKSLGERHHLFMTTQTKFQSNPTLRALLDYFIYPEIIVKLKPDNRGLQKPVIIKLDWYQKIKRTIPPTFWYVKTTYRYVLPTCDLYSTYEEVEPLKDLSFIKHLKTYKTFVGRKNQIKNLYVLIQSKEGLNKTTSKELARKIIYANELFPEFL